MVQWTAEQQEAIKGKDSNILVAAAAGSGKTAVLVERIIQKLLDEKSQINIDEILVATFTNAAAEEMRNRIAAALENEIKKDPTSYHLKKQLSLIQRSSISTLHSFCTTVVRQYAYLLDLDPGFRIADEMEMDLIKQDIIDDMFEDAYGLEGEEREQFFNVVDMFASDRSDIAVEQLILSLYTFAMQNPWPEKWLDHVAETYFLPENSTEANLPWLELLREDLIEQFESFYTDIEQAIRLAKSSDGPYHYAEALEADLVLIEEVLSYADDWDALYDYMTTAKMKSLSRKRVECDEEKREKIRHIRQRFRDQFNDLRKEWFSRHLTGHMDDMRKLYPSIVMLTKLVKDFKERFSKEKRDRAIVDFTDLEHFCLAILLDDTSTDGHLIPSDIAHYYKNQFKEVLVDEYQDINLVQETILTMVSDETGPGNMFMVGDVKQSIYRFRHAEPSLFIEKYKNYEAHPSLGKRIDLARNFRSRSEILEGANYIFKQIFDEAIGEIDYDEKAELIYGNKGYDDVPLKEPEIEVVLIDKHAETDENEAVEELLSAQLEARLYAKKIKSWIGSEEKQPFQVIDKETGQKRGIQYRDIVILLRSLSSLPTIMDELKKQGIPVYAELKTGYFSAIEIQVMINVLKIIDNPYQDIPLASVLRSPIVGFNEEQLAQIRLANKKSSFYEALLAYSNQTGPDTEVVRKFLQRLKRFRHLAQQGALSELIWDVYRETGYYDFVGGIPGGRQRQANLRALYDRARRYEETSFRGLFRFLRFIERMEEERSDLGEARALSEQEDVVRIMTIHKSKGLEFPVVIIGEMNKEFNFMDFRRRYILDKDYGFATKYIDPEKRITYSTLYYLALQRVGLNYMLSEEMRVLYVAMTRAKEKLVMIGQVSDLSKELSANWGQFLDHDEWLLPKQSRRRAKTFFDWIIPSLIRHENHSELHGDEMISQSVPKDIRQHQSKWDITVVKGQELSLIEEEQTVSNMDIEDMIQSWSGVSETLLKDGLTDEVTSRLEFEYPYLQIAKSQAKQSVTEIKRRLESEDDYSANRIVRNFQSPMIKRPRFLQTEQTLSAAEIGTAMHAVMQHIPLTKPWIADDLSQFIETLVERELLTQDEAEVIDVHVIEQFFKSDLGHLLLQADYVEREVPFTYALPANEVYKEWETEQNENVLIQGVIDCIIHTKEGLIIVDYKTDAIREEVTDELVKKLKEHYDVQINLYRRALSDIINEPVHEAYLYFFAKNLIIRM